MRTISLFLSVFFAINITMAQSFAEQQKKFPRVQQAYVAKWETVKALIAAKVDDGKFELVLNAYKHEQILEIWIKGHMDNPHQLLKTYPFCANSGTLGPKLQEGDLQIPEGNYFINVFNPMSSFHLSLGLNYPNRVDKVRSGSLPPGTDIYLHGGCATVGCISITDNFIKELYILAVEATNSGQRKIPVNIYPFRMTASNLTKFTRSYPMHQKFWSNLQRRYLAFK
ncbi:MAG: hypothetical protein EOO01_42960 [Chitinophagaceae bacterium]|nr:MAG: hypothetical protein EOO01_42960 [Chitinophagaceae bacterium]